MPASLTLSIAEPCHQSWAHMTPAAQGRHCAACSKVVVDFTQKTDAEILALLRRAAASCGRFRADQLDRVLQLPPAPAPRWRTWLAAAATVLGLRELDSEQAQAQRAPTHHSPATLAMEPLPPRVPEARAAGSLEIRGWVMGDNHARVDDAAVRIDGTELTTTTGLGGSFVLPTPASARVGSTLVLNVAAPGYVPQQVAVLLEAGPGQLLTIRLRPLAEPQPRSIVLGGISAVRVVVRQEERHFTAADLENAARLANRRNP